MGLPITLVPYEAARGVTIGPDILARMSDHGGSSAWVAQHARPWLSYWREDIGREGFYPFDLIAASYVVQPSLLRCAELPIAVEDDTWLFGWLGYRGLFVATEKQSDSHPYATGSALYCPKVSEDMEDWLINRSRQLHDSSLRDS